MSSAGTAFVDLEPRLGPAWATGLASKFKAFLPVAAVTAVGGALFGIGEKFEGTFNKIRVQTGATGATFDKLKQDTKNVLAGTAGSFDQVGAAVGGLFQRTHLTGQALDDLAKQQVTLARITKTDVGTNVESTTALFNRYGVATKNQSRELDVLFKASQQGGKGIGILIAEMQKGAPALTAFGFGFEKSAALVAGLERAGVNVAPVLTGLRTGFGKIAKEGGDPQKVLAAVFKELKDGKDPTKATADAIKLFGARGGKELSDAVRAGRFDVAALFKTITDGKGGIIATGAEVSTIGSKFARLKNIALVALEPIASKLVDLANVGLGKVVSAVTAAGPIISHAFGAIQAGFSGAVAGKNVDGITKVFTTIGTTARGIVTQLAPVGAQIVEIFGQVSDAIAGIDFGKVFADVAAAVGPIIVSISKIDFGAVFGRAVAIVKPLLGPLRELAVNVGKLALAALPVLKKSFQDLKPVLIALVAGAYVLARVAGVVLAVAIKATAAATGLLSRHASILRPVLFALVTGFVALKIVHGVQAGILGVAKAAGTAYGTMQRLAAQTVKYASNLKSGIQTVVSFGKSVLTSAFNIGKQVAAFVAQKAAALAAAVAQKAMAAAQWLLNVAMDANPIGLVVAGIAALTAGVILAYQHFKPFRDVVDALGRVFLSVFNWVKSHWPQLLLILTGPFALAVLAIKANWDRISGFATAAFTWVKTHWPLLLGILTGPIGLAVLAIKANWSKITGFARGAFDWVESHWPLLLAILTGPIGLAVLAIKKFGPKLLDGITTAFSKVVSFFKGLPAEILGAFGKVGSILFDVGREILGGLIRGAISGAASLVQFITGLSGAVLTALGNVGSWLLDAGSKMIGGLWAGIKADWAREVHFWSDLLPKILGSLGTVGNWLLDTGKTIVKGLWRGIKFAWQAEFDFWSRLPGQIFGALGDVGAWLLDVGKRVVRGLWKGIKFAWNAEFAFWSQLPGKILDALGNAAGWLVGTGGKIIGGLASGVVTNAFRVFNFFRGLKDKILSAIGDVTSWLYNIGKDLISGFLNGIKDRWNDLTGWLGSAASHLPGFIKGPLGIKSPSTVFHVIGGNVMQGLANGLDAGLAPVKAKLAELAATFKATPTDLPASRLIGIPKSVPLERFAAPFTPPPIPRTDTTLARAALAQFAPSPSANGNGPAVHQENHFHGHEHPTATDIDLAGRKLAFMIANTGRRP